MNTDQQSCSNPSRESWVHTSIHTHTHALTHPPPKHLHVLSIFWVTEPHFPRWTQYKFSAFCSGSCTIYILSTKSGSVLSFSLPKPGEAQNPHDNCLGKPIRLKGMLVTSACIVSLWPLLGPLHKRCQSPPPMRGKHRRLRTLTNLHPLSYPAPSVSCWLNRQRIWLLHWKSPINLLISLFLWNLWLKLKSDSKSIWDPWKSCS